MTDLPFGHSSIDIAGLGAIQGAPCLSSMYHAIESILPQILGASPSGLFIVWDKQPDLDQLGHLIDHHQLEDRSYLKSFSFGTSLREFRDQCKSSQLQPVSQADWLDSVYPTRPEWFSEARHLLIVPLFDHNQNSGLLAVGVTDGELPLNTLQPELEHLSMTIAPVLRNLFRIDELHEENRQQEFCQHLMLKTVLATDRKSILNLAMRILTRELGFARVRIYLLNQNQSQLKCELHTGFEAALEDTPAVMGSEFFMNVMREGSVCIVRANSMHWEELPDFNTRASTEAVALFPLKSGGELLGCIYAEQAPGSHTPLLSNVLNSFAQLISVSLENFTQRTQSQMRAETDPLTGMYNRYYLDKILAAEIPRVKRYNTPISLLMIDLNEFKNTNDTYGHVFGDYILRETANLIQANVRRPDIVVRYGGDEFVVLMVNTSYDQAQLVRNRIERAFIERNRTQQEPKMQIMISIGLRSADAESINQLLHAADEAMYDHKASLKRRSLLEYLVRNDMDKIESSHHVVASLYNILLHKIPGYREHAKRVAHLSLLIGRRLGLTDEELTCLGLAAMLHDVGKVSLPGELLNKTVPLTEAELTALRNHPALGEMFFEGVDYLEPIRPIIRGHHESYDGKPDAYLASFPDQLQGEAIALPARILCLAENADGKLAGHTYHPRVGFEEAIEFIRNQAGRLFDPRLVRTLLSQTGWHVNLGDVDEIVNLMGDPHDYEEEGAAANDG